MDLFGCSDIAKHVLLFLDFPSLLQFRTLSKHCKATITDCTPLLCQRDKVEQTKFFFQWALSYSRKYKTVYSYLFHTKDVNCCHDCTEPSKELLALEELLNAGDFELANSYVTPQLINQGVLIAFFTQFGEQKACLDWFFSSLEMLLVNNDIGVKDVVLEAAFTTGEAEIIARTWAVCGQTGMSKDSILRLVQQGRKTELALFYLLDTLYPNLELLAENYSDVCVPTSWIVEKLKEPVTFGKPHWESIFLTQALCTNDLSLCKLLEAKNPECNPAFSVQECSSLETLEWLYERHMLFHEGVSVSAHNRVFVDHYVENPFLVRALELNCSLEVLKRILAHRPSELISLAMLCKVQTREQYECLLPLLSEDVFYGNIAIGNLMLLQYYDRERFHPKKALNNNHVDADQLKWTLDKYATEIDWDALVEAHLYHPQPRADLLSLILCKDVQIHGGLAKRWTYDAQKRKEAHSICCY